MTEATQKGIKIKIVLETIINILIVISVIVDTFLLIMVEFYPLGPDLVDYIIYFDLFVCFILFCEFVHKLKDEKDKTRFIKENWLDIIAMVPIDFFILRMIRFMRIFRVLSIFKVIRLFVLSNKSVKDVIRCFKETHLDWIFIVLIATITSGTIFFYILEKGINPNINSIWDSFWYVMPTLITSSSNLNPVTDWGRIIDLILMLVGLIFFGMFSALVSSWLVKKPEKEKNEEMEKKEQKKLLLEMQLEIQELKELIKNKKIR